ncbi:MAG: LysR family transcriptional regulator [Betaproteobacteria bacterium]|nr:MAG: LysR family transcriptional regulator [Betaproteobacteria bacterium]
MNLRHLQLFCEVVNANLNISAAAKALHTSQPSVSRHLLSLESELGVALFVRSKKRLLGLTGPGEAVLESARRVLFELENINQAGTVHGREKRGNLVVAASHTHARYSLPNVVRAFIAQYPNVRLVLRQGDPHQIAEWVASGNADIGICAEPLERPKGIKFFPCHKHHRIILAPQGHPLAAIKKPTLTQLSRYPLITYEAPFTVHRRIVEAFENIGLSPTFVLTATDVDVMKTYVKAGLGLAIVASLAHNAEEDTGLVAISASHLFKPDLIKVALRKGTYQRSYTYDFIELFSPTLKREQLQAKLFDQRR